MIDGLHVHRTADTVEVRIRITCPVLHAIPVEFEDGVITPIPITGFGGVQVPIRLVSSGPSSNIDAEPPPKTLLIE